MFLGEYQHSLDAKGRVILPSKYRDQLSDGAYVTKGRGGCLSVYAAQEFSEVADRVREGSKRHLGPEMTRVAEVTPDKQGRIAIPQHLREYAGLDRDVVVAGVFSRVEIWDGRRWQERDREGEHSLNESDELPDFGI